MASSGGGSPRSAASSSCVSASSGGVRPQFMDAVGFPTTFIQADADSFKRVVQKLTGHSKAPPGPKKQPFKLYERRGGLKAIRPPAPAKPPPPLSPATLSPSVLGFPSLALVSPITPLVPDPFRGAAAVAEEERAIADKGFYLHPPPRSAVEPPRLLSLFPVTSPTTPPASSSS